MRDAINVCCLVGATFALFGGLWIFVGYAIGLGLRLAGAL